MGQADCEKTSFLMKTVSCGGMLDGTGEGVVLPASYDLTLKFQELPEHASYFLESLDVSQCYCHFGEFVLRLVGDFRIG